MESRQDALTPGCVVSYYSFYERRIVDCAVSVISPDGQFFMTSSYPPQVLRCDQVEINRRAANNWRDVTKVLAGAAGDPRQAWAIAYLIKHTGD